MDFFDNATIQDVAEQNVSKVVRLEDKEAEKLLETLKQVRTELLDRLLFIPEGTFSQQHLRATMNQINEMIRALNIRLGADLSESAMVLGERGVGDFVEELTKFSRVFEGSIQPINIDAAVMTLNAKNLLINRMKASLAAYGESLRTQITQGLTESIIARDSFSRAVFRVNRFMKAEEWRVQRIARTELHNMYNMAKQESMLFTREEQMPDLMKALYHPMDARTGEDSKFVSKLDLIVPVDKPFKYKWSGKEREFMFPPDRPNDRSILLPFRKGWRE